jgi:Transglutaminase-like superfamily
LFVACARHLGIPARTACGFWVGASPHCWAEFYMPGHGWVLCDGSSGNAWSEYGKFAYCFGNQFDWNARMAFMRGNTFKVGDYHTPWLQGPAGPWVSGSASVAHSKVLTTINEAPVARLQRVITDSSGVRTRRMKIQCPCERHGGFRPTIRFAGR